MLTTYVYPSEGGYKWYVVSDYNFHVLAQGMRKNAKAAQNAAEATAATFRYEFFGEFT